MGLVWPEGGRSELPTARWRGGEEMRATMRLFVRERKRIGPDFKEKREGVSESLRQVLERARAAWARPAAVNADVSAQATRRGMGVALSGAGGQEVVGTGLVGA